MASITREWQLQAFSDAFTPEIESAYYPACGSDVAPWNTFPEATIVGVDIDDFSVGLLHEQGVSPVHVADVGDFDFDEPVDAVFLLGHLFKDVKLSTLTSSIKPGGYVVTDSYVNAGDIAGRQKQDFKIAGKIDRNGLPETSPVDGGEITGLGILQYLQDRHRSPIPIGTICLELELTMPDTFKSDLLILRRN